MDNFILNTPIYRAKKNNCNEYVEGYYVVLTTEEEIEHIIYSTEFKSKDYEIMHCVGLESNVIDPTTLAIHFSDSINTNSEKVWYNMEEISNIVKEYENGKVETS